MVNLLSNIATTLFYFYLCIYILGCKSHLVEGNQDLLMVGIASDPSTLDPIFAVDLTAQKINSLLFSKLFKFEKEGNIKGELVKDFSLKSNRLYIKLHALNTVNNANLTSADVRYSLERLLKEKGPRRSKYQFIHSFKIISDLELELTLHSSNSKNLELLALAPASIYQEVTHKTDGSFKSSGLYFLEKWNKNEILQLRLNQLQSIDSDNKNYPQNLVLQVLNQPSSAIYLFQKGNLDVLKVPYFLLKHPAVKENEKKIVKGKSVQYIAINHNNPCFDLDFRKALNYSINRDLIIEKIFESHASPINASVTDEYLEKYTKEKFYYNYNITLAKEHLFKSKCYPKLLSKPLELRMRADDENKAKGAVIAQYLKDLGLKIVILPMEKTKLYKENGEKKGDLTLLTWYIDYDSIHNFIDPLFAKDSFGNAGNRAFYSNPEIEDYIRQIRISPEQAQSPVTIVRTIQEDAPWIFLWSIHENYIVSPKATKFPHLVNLLIQ